MSEQENMIEARKAQQFFREAINCCMEKNTTKFFQLVDEYMARNTHVSFLDVFNGFQTEGKNLLHISCSSGCLEIVKYILDRAGDNAHTIVNVADQKGFTPLIYAINSESNEVIELILKQSPEINLANCDGATALHFAAGDGSLNRVQLLIKAGANISLSTPAGTPLHWAAGKGHTDVVKHLLTLNVDVNTPNSTGLPSVFLAAVSGRDECTAAIINQPGVDIGAILSDNLTLLHICAENGLLESVKGIVKLEQGVKLVNVYSADMLLPIQLASISGFQEIVTILKPLSTVDSNICNIMSVDDVLAKGPEYLAQWEKRHSTSATDSKSSADTIMNKVPPAESTDPAATPEDEQKSESMKELGNKAFALEKNYHLAINYYTGAIELNGSNHTLWSNRAACYLALNNAVIDVRVGSEVTAVPSNILALRDAEICRSLAPKWVKGCYRLAQARLANNLFEDAAVAAFEGCNLDNNNKECKELLVKAVKMGQDDHQTKIKEKSALEGQK